MLWMVIFFWFSKYAAFIVMVGIPSKLTFWVKGNTKTMYWETDANIQIIKLLKYSFERFNSV